MPEKAACGITFPRVEGYQQAIKSKLTVDWGAVGARSVEARRMRFPPKPDIKHLIVAATGRAGLSGPQHWSM